jgi:hypothetical protein
MLCRSTFVQHDSLESPCRLHTLYNACSNPPFTTLLNLLDLLAALRAFFLFNYTISLQLVLYIIVKSRNPTMPEPPLTSRSQDCLSPLGSISSCLIYSTRSRTMYPRWTRPRLFNVRAQPRRELNPPLRLHQRAVTLLHIPTPLILISTRPRMDDQGLILHRSRPFCSIVVYTLFWHRLPRFLMR